MSPSAEKQLQEGVTPEAPSKVSDHVVGRYRLIKRLGRGGMGTVYLGFDTHENRHVALKRVRRDRLDPKALGLLRNEYLSLAALRHPNLARVFDFGLDTASNEVFFTSEFVDGTDWGERTATLDMASPQGQKEFLDVATQVLRALEYIHYRQLIHGDIKPENILISAASSGEEAAPIAKLIDFGLVKREREFGGRTIMGSIHYMAPETILGARVDRRTDLYSFGVLLYHLATGDLPFRGENNLEVFKGHLEGTPRPPTKLAPHLPSALGALILRLMEKKPADRFQSAIEVIEALNRELDYSFSLETDDTLGSYLDYAGRLGREYDLEKLNRLFGEVARTKPLGEEDDGPLKDLVAVRKTGPVALPNGNVILLRGEQGLGKCRLVEQLGELVQTQGGRTLRIDCRSAKTPWMDFVQLIKELTGNFGEVKHRDDLGFLKPAHEMVRRLGEGKLNAKDRSFREALQDMALGLLRCCQKQPALIFFRDLHVAGKAVIDFIELLTRLLAAEQGPKSRVVIVASTLDQADIEGSAFHGLYQKSEFRRVVAELKLERLEGDQVGRIIHTVFAPNSFPDAFIHRVLEESDGNPDIVIDILGFLLRNRHLERTVSGWILNANYEREAFPGKVRSQLKAKISKLPPEALRLAVAFAFLGDETELELAAQLAKLAPSAVQDTLRLLRREKLIQERVEGDPRQIYSFVHSSARDILYHQVPREERSALHDTAGRLSEAYYSKHGPEQPKKLAHHFLRSTDRQKALHYGVRAARLLAQEVKPLRALEVYEQVLAVATAGEGEVAIDLRLEIAALRLRVGDYAGVLETVGALLNLDGSARQTEACLFAARARARLGLFQKAAASIQRALTESPGHDLLGQSHLAMAELYALKGDLVECLRCCDRLEGMPDGLSEPLDQARLCLLKAEVNYRLGNQSSAVKMSREALQRVDSIGGKATPDVNLFYLGKYHKHQGKWKMAIREFEVCAIANRRSGVGEMQASCHLEIGRLNLFLDDPQSALPHLQRAAELFRRSANAPMSMETLCALAEVQRLIGDSEECRKGLVEASRLAEALKNKEGKTKTLVCHAALSMDNGDLENAESYFQEADIGSSNIGSSTRLPLVEVQFSLAMQKGDLGSALVHATLGEEGENGVRRSRLLFHRALLHCRVGRRAEARRAVVALMETAKAHGFALAEGRARLLEGMIATCEKKEPMAERSFEQADRILARQGSERDLVELYLEYGKFHLQYSRHEQAYLLLEEGFYLAKKLRVEYLKCWYYFMLGNHEAALPKGQPQRAEERLRLAMHIAQNAGFVEVLWQVRYRLGKLLAATGNADDAEELLQQAAMGRKKAASRMPAMLRASYLRAVGGKELEKLVTS